MRFSETIFRQVNPVVTPENPFARSKSRLLTRNIWTCCLLWHVIFVLYICCWAKSGRRAKKYFSTFFAVQVPGERVFAWFKLINCELRVTCSWSLLTGVLGSRSVCRVNSFDCRLSTRCCNSAFSTKNLHSLSRNWRSSSPICVRWLISFFFDESVAEYKNLYVTEDADNTVSSRSGIACGKSRSNRNFHK